MRQNSVGSLESGIAVVGVGCRLPGRVESPQDYWRLLRDGVDAISETPPERWNLQQFYFPDQIRPGKTQSRWGGYVDQIDRFDPQLFGISPKEAASMDPQQRMLLEVAWRAMEDGGHPIRPMAGSPCGVFVGISSFDYAVAGLSFGDRGVIGSYNNTGSSSSIAANRISYCFDLRGPSLAVDTACSSSLVALHLACQSLRRGECEVALAGGVNALLLPDFYVGFSQLGVLSPDGRCKTFDAAANGYVRSEGAGMVLLKPLKAALRDRDRIYCVIRGSALNQDGHTPGLTVPSREAQQRLVESACRQAQVDPADIQYVEAHGTGTPVGDPIEAGALGAVLGRASGRDQPCLVGSVKTNIGHLEAGAGIASLIKVALAIHHRQVPAHLNLRSLNPSIDFDGLGLSVPSQTTAWPNPDELLLAGINGFGYGGANAHLIVSEPPQAASIRAGSESETVAGRWETERTRVNRNPATSPVNPAVDADKDFPLVLPISARTQGALAEAADRWADFLADVDSQAAIREAAATAAHRRDHFEYRRAVVGSSSAPWSDTLRELADQLRSPSTTSSHDHDRGVDLDAGILFVCCGQGTQWSGMGRQLYAANATYREMIDRCDREYAKHVDWSLREELHRDAPDSRLHQTSIAQPALFAVQVALAASLESIGIRAKAVVGHSVGEIAAAYISGSLGFEDACLVAIERGRNMDLASSAGAMIAAGLSESEAKGWIEKLGSDVCIAAINGPGSVTMAGPKESVTRLAAELDAAGVFCKQLAVEYAFHSQLMDPVRDALLNSLSGIEPGPTDIDLISTVTGQWIDGDSLDAHYWWQNVRRSVRFADAMERAAERGFQVVVELGPHPTLTYSINECCQAIGHPVRVVPTLRREEPDAERFADAIAGFYELGVDLDWQGVMAPPTQWMSIPPYPFQRQSLWSESYDSRRTRLASSHPILGIATDDAEPTWQSRIDLGLQQIFRDHRVRGSSVLPAAATVEGAIAAANQLGYPAPVTLERCLFQRAGMLSDDRPLHLRTSFQEERGRLLFAARSGDEKDWSELARAELIRDAAVQSPMAPSLAAVREGLTDAFDQDRLYDYCERLGLDYGERFRGVVRGWRRSHEALAEVELHSAESFQYQAGLDPAVLDSCFHAMIAADPCFDHAIKGLYLPAEIKRVQVHKPLPNRVWAHVRIRVKTDRRLLADLDLFDQDEQLCVTIRGFLSKRVSGGEEDETLEDWLYSYRWREAELEEDGIVALDETTSTTWCLLTDRSGLGEELAVELASRDDRVIWVEHGDRFEQRTSNRFVINPGVPEDYQRLIRDSSLLDDGGNLHWVYLWGLDVPASNDLDCRALDHSTVLTAQGPLHLVQAWDQLAGSRSARLTVLTAAAQSPDDLLQPITVAAMPLLGFARVIVSEYSAFRTRLIDVPDLANGIPSWLLTDLLRELRSVKDSEDEVMLRDHRRYVHRFERNFEQPLPPDAAARVQSRLESGETQGMDGLHHHFQPCADLQADEVEIKVLAAGLNFSDVMKSLQLYPSDTEILPGLGVECCGKITRVGSGVTQWSVGDEVIAVAPGSFATHATVPAALLARKPSGLTDEQAAAIPIAFLTAAHALHTCARIVAGETVLIHAASGGVGLAAMQLARQAGARILATAGSEEKREYVRQLGAHWVGDSRTLSFADEVMLATDQQGVDVILNSLPGAAIDRGLAALKVGGRFLEIGKRDIYSDRSLGMYPLRNNLALFAIDLDQLFKCQPERIGISLREIAEKFERNELQPLPVRCWEADEVDAAFRFMQQAKHVGKLVVNYQRTPQQVYPSTRGEIQCSSDSTYWIVGGLGGFGLQVASWLVGRGVGTLVLSGRSRTPSEEAKAAIEALRREGVDVRLMPVDVTDPLSVREVLTQIQRELPPIKGVVHAAMVLEDQLLVDLDIERLQRVLRPKVLGGWNLHEATRELELDHFILFSSLSSVFGHAGQANYSAANALLDGLAHHRRALGLPATVVNWGHLGEVGYLARREELGDRLRRQGVLSFSVRQAFECLEHILAHQLIQTSVLRMDWKLWRGLGISGDISPRFAHLVDFGATQDVSVASADQIRQVDGDDRRQLLDQLLRFKVSNLLGLKEAEIDLHRSLVEMGLDSLMAVELRNWLEGQVRVALPIAQLMRDTSVGDLIQLLSDAIDEELPATDGQLTMTEITEESTGSFSSSGELDSDEAMDLLGDLAEMPADQVASLLGQLLREQEASSDEHA